MEIKYGEKEILEFDINNEENFWPNENSKNYIIDIELPEFMAKCPRSGYPDFATIKIQYTPNKKVIELKALKIYINSFMNRYISHENSANEIFDTLFNKLEPKWLKVVADWIFFYLKSSQLVAPHDYPIIRNKIMKQVEMMNRRGEPNVIEIYPKLNEILTKLGM
jgi:7-cyano-7-deazaguanine reductase